MSEKNSPLPTSPALDALVGNVIARCQHRKCSIADTLAAIRRAQDHATLESLGRAPATETRGAYSQEPIVFDLDVFRRAHGLAPRDNGPEAA